MRWMIVLAVLSVTACGQMSASTTEESMALAQTKSSAWQDEDGKMLSAVEVQRAYRACQDSTFSPPRASAAMITPLWNENFRFALTGPELDVCMHSFGYSHVGSPTDATRSGMN
jgi:hypothetical protein